MSAQKVLFVINSLAGGGAERVMTTLLEESLRSGRPEAISLALLDREEIAYPPPPGMDLHQLDARGSLVRSVRQLSALCARLRPDIIVSFLTRANVASVAVGRSLGARVVISERVATSSHLTAGLGGRAASALVRLFYPLAHVVIAVSQGVADDLQQNFGVAPRRIRVVSNPVDAAKLRRLAQSPADDAPTDRFIVGVGRLAPNKNFALLLRAFAASGVDGKLVILGEGPERGRLLELAGELGVAGRVSLPGYRENPFALVARAELYVLASNAEGFPNGLVEAMALGRPVISTNCASGPSEILADLPRAAVSGLTFATYGVLTPTQAVQPLSQALRRLWSDEPLASRYGRLAASRAETYGVSKAAERYWRVIGGSA